MSALLAKSTMILKTTQIKNGVVYTRLVLSFYDENGPEKERKNRISSSQYLIFRNPAGHRDHSKGFLGVHELNIAGH